MAPKPNPKNERYRVEDLFVSSLRQELGGLCVAGLAGCCEKLFKPRTAERSNRVIRAGMQFLAGDRTMQEHREMTASIVLCRCNIKDQFILDLHKSVSTIDPLNFTILELAFAIMDALSPRPKGAPVEDDTGKDLAQVVLGMEDWLVLADAEDQLGPLPADWDLPDELKEEPDEVREDEPPWPSGPEDVFPSTQGLGQTLQNLLLWTAHPCGGSGVFLLLSRLADYAPSFAAEVSTARIAMPCAMVHLEQALDRFEAKAPPETFRLALASVTHFMHHMDTRRFVRLLFEFNDIMLDLSARIQPALAEMPGAEAAFAKTWWSSLRRGIQAGPAYAWDQFGRPEFDNADTVVVDSAELYRLMRTHRERNVCKKPDCAHRKETAKAMMFCRRCALTCYCSAECQKHAWSKGEAPHKRLCNAVDALRRTTGLVDDAIWREVLTHATSKAAERFAQICAAKSAGGDLCLPIAHQLMVHDTAMWAASGS
ncbi:hypothetical protein DFH07DRAFT_943767 [Mycena maculata]|uniref:MYND-type domain-containing protein n=1 Tax=Mycena maculata TaxID=230809 RepID=A0AAD7IEJ4_9AGAR|nr:hypothetical protein DFH07DRAFT_943767 [Mycena maculata]